MRMALGARRVTVLRAILREGLVLTTAGLVIGLGLAALSSGLIASLLYQIEPSDPATLGLIVGGLVTISMATCLWPALRATRVDPMTVLREE